LDALTASASDLLHSQVARQVSWANFLDKT
jgi:hypothetical protein